MANSISDYYKIISSMASQITRTTNNTQVSNQDNSKSSTDNISVADILDFNSSANNVPSYLNYNASGNYNSLPSLAELLDQNSDSEDNDLFNVLGSNSSDDSLTAAFDGIADEKSKEIDDLISQALSRLSSSLKQPSSTADNEEKDGK